MGLQRFGVAVAVLMTATGAAAHLKTGDPAPRFAIDLFDRQKVTADQLRGQVVIVNRWATWCGPCKEELPALDAYYRKHAGAGLRIFAVTTEDSVPDYMLKPLSGALAFPLAHRITGSGFDVMEGVPTNYIIDRRGVVRYAKAAAFDADTLEAIVGPLLAEPMPAAVQAP